MRNRERKKRTVGKTGSLKVSIRNNTRQTCEVL